MATANVLHVMIVTPEKVLFDADVKYVHVPGGAGSFGVLVDHTPMLASLKPGPFEIVPLNGEPIKFTTAHAGFFEVVKNGASILLDAMDVASFPQR